MRRFALSLGIFLLLTQSVSAVSFAYSKKVQSYLQQVDALVANPPENALLDGDLRADDPTLLERMGLTVTDFSSSWDDLFAQECLRNDLQLLENAKERALQAMQKRIRDQKGVGGTVLSEKYKQIEVYKQMIRVQKEAFDPIYASGNKQCPTDTGDIFDNTKKAFDDLKSAYKNFSEVKWGFDTLMNWNLDQMTGIAEQEAKKNAVNWINEQLSRTGLIYFFQLKTSEEKKAEDAKKQAQNKSVRTSAEKPIVGDEVQIILQQKSQNEADRSDANDWQAWRRAHAVIYESTDATQNRLAERLSSKNSAFEARKEGDAAFTVEGYIKLINMHLDSFTKAVRELQQQQCKNLSCPAE